MLPSWLERSKRGAVLVTAFLIPAGYPVIGLVLLVLAIIVEGVVRGRIPWRSSPVDVLLAGFTAVFLVSGWFSQYRPMAVGSAGLAALTIYLAFGPLYQLLRRDVGFLKTLLRAWVAGGILAAAWGFYLHRLTGLPAFTPQLPQNSLATAILIGLVLDLGLFLTSNHRWRYVTAGGYVLFFLTLTVTTSRGAWLAAAFALISFFSLVGFRYVWQGILLTVLAVVAVITFTTTTTTERTRLSLEKENPTFDRILLARTAEAIFLDHPVFGTGLNTYSLVHSKYKLPGDTNVAPPYAHNVFINMAAEGGALGFAAFTAIVIWAGIAGWRWHSASTSQPEIIMSATIFSAFLATLVQQMFDGTVLSVHLGTALWFLIAILAAFRPHPRPVQVS